MREFLRSRFNRAKLQHLYLQAALGNFVGFVAGSLVTVTTTYRSVEGRSIRNLFGILPRKTVVVHLLPQWLEWALAILVGYVVMELVRSAFTYSTRTVAFRTLRDGPVSRVRAGENQGARG